MQPTSILLFVLEIFADRQWPKGFSKANIKQNGFKWVWDWFCWSYRLSSGRTSRQPNENFAEKRLSYRSSFKGRFRDWISNDLIWLLVWTTKYWWIEGSCNDNRGGKTIFKNDGLFAATCRQIMCLIPYYGGDQASSMSLIFLKMPAEVCLMIMSSKPQ